MNQEFDWRIAAEHILACVHLSVYPHLTASASLSKFIVHRDLKPSNILLTLDMSGNAMVRLADFGSAADTRKGAASRLCGGVLGPSRDDPADNMTGLATWTCTVQYAAPEILLGGVVPKPFWGSRHRQFVIEMLAAMCVCANYGCTVK